MFPVAIAIGCIHIGTMIGKLNGVIPAHTPERLAEASAGRRRSRPGRRTRPSAAVGIPQANSTTSMPRITSPLASSSTLPCSDAMIRASSSVCWSTSSRKANMIRARRTTDTSLQVCERLPGRLHRGVDVGRLGQQHLGLLARRWRGRRRGRCGWTRRASAAPPMRWRMLSSWTVLTVSSRSRVLSGNCAASPGRARRRRARRVWSASAATSATGTSHHASLSGAGTSGSVSTWTTQVASAAIACAQCVLQVGDARPAKTRAPRLGAFGGEVDRQHVAVGAALQAVAVAVPKRCEPTRLGERADRLRSRGSARARRPA